MEEDLQHRKAGLDRTMRELPCIIDEQELYSSVLLRLLYHILIKTAGATGREKAEIKKKNVKMERMVEGGYRMRLNC